MHKETVYYARFLAPGSFFAETWTVPLAEPSPHAVAWPDNAYAFDLFMREDVVDGDARYEGKASSVGPTYYHPDSKVETLAEAEQNPKATRIMLANMRCNGWQQIVWNRWGNWPQPFDPAKDCVLQPTTAPEIA